MKMKKYTHSAQTMEILKESTRELITLSRQNQGKHDATDEFIDLEVINIIEQINENPDLATAGSSSGRDGVPFVSVVFRNFKIRDNYLAKVQEYNVDNQVFDEYQLQYFTINFPTIFVHEAWSFADESVIQIESPRRIWHLFKRIFLAKKQPDHHNDIKHEKNGCGSKT